MTPEQPFPTLGDDKPKIGPFSHEYPEGYFDPNYPEVPAGQEEREADDE